MAAISEMDRATKGLKTKSDKIRTLAGRGYKRADIARYLHIRYQHVRNVLVREEGRQEASAVGGKPDSDPGPAKVRLGPDGRLVIPASYREALGLADGDTLFVRIENNEIRLITPQAAMRQAESVLRDFVPKGVSLADELIAERRREAASE